MDYLYTTVQKCGVGKSKKYFMLTKTVYLVKCSINGNVVKYNSSLICNKINAILNSTVICSFGT